MANDPAKKDLVRVSLLITYEDYLALCNDISANVVFSEKAIQRHIPAAKRAFDYYRRLQTAFNRADVDFPDP